MAGLNTLFSVLLNKYNPSQWGYFQQNKFQDFRNCIKFSTDAQDSLDITSFSIEITFSVYSLQHLEMSTLTEESLKTWNDARNVSEGEFPASYRYQWHVVSLL